ncbi:dephospho-CoA kinase [Roseicyclus mahoneyensis]|uniref:Dephospho-CoA kinase n=1 Tax=Roseicyclus mahoneyensis TaxID=164332 RepID=A0A316GPY9_9RHOB|nr:dephospho-CoA kinase [Roseicyclus mahoneyensis]PWK61584.1 dephospho-CoA kinase [Roseicyclus mahoneyensis]
MSFRLALTGSIGMGKSTTADMFRSLGIPVWDADETVHRLYARGGAAVGPVAALVPDALQDGMIDRGRLRAAIRKDPDLLVRLESIVHPLVAADRGAFCAEHAAAPLILLDIPLLFETGGEAAVDAVLVVSTDPQTQRARVMARPDMTEDLYWQILSRQVPDAEKRSRADYLIETNTLEQTRTSVAELVERLTSGGAQDA